MPTSSTLADVDQQIKAESAAPTKDQTDAPSHEGFPCCAEATIPTHGQRESVEQIAASEAEPYMMDLVDKQCSSLTPESEDGFSVCVSMKKWPPLTDADITEISEDDAKVVQEQEVWVDERVRFRRKEVRTELASSPLEPG